MDFGSKRKISSGTLADIDLLECTICCNNLTSTVYQCEFGHCVCEHCWLRLGYVCPTCKKTLGVNRCKVVEKIIKKTVIRCPYAAVCQKSVGFSSFNRHVLDGCVGSKCFCPHYVMCNEKGDPDWIVDHFLNNHWPTEEHKAFFEFETPINVTVIPNLQVLYLFSWTSDVLFTYQCFKEDNGVWVDVTCIAPPASEMYHFSYLLSYTHEEQEITYACKDMTKKIKMVYGYPKKATAYFIPKTHMESGELNLVLTIS